MSSPDRWQYSSATSSARLLWASFYLFEVVESFLRCWLVSSWWTTFACDAFLLEIFSLTCGWALYWVCKKMDNLDDWVQSFNHISLNLQSIFAASLLLSWYGIIHLSRNMVCTFLAQIDGSIIIIIIDNLYNNNNNNSSSQLIDTNSVVFVHSLEIAQVLSCCFLLTIVL